MRHAMFINGSVVLAGLIVLGVTEAHAGTFITSAGSNPYSQADFEFPGPPPSGFALPDDRNGTIYVTGLGTNIRGGSSARTYDEDIQVQGTGTFAVFNGTAHFFAFRNGQDPHMYFEGINGDYRYSMEFINPLRGSFQYNYNEVFTEKDIAGLGKTMNGNAWDTVTWAVEQLSTGLAYSASSDDVRGNGGFSITSNNLVIAPTIEEPGLPIPEPGSWALMAMGLGAVGVARRCRGGSTTRVVYSV